MTQALRGAFNSDCRSASVAWGGFMWICPLTFSNLYFMYSIPLVLYFHKGPLFSLMQDSSKRQKSNCLYDPVNIAVSTASTKTMPVVLQCLGIKSSSLFGKCVHPESGVIHGRNTDISCQKLFVIQTK